MVMTIQLLGTITVMSQVGWEVLLLFLPVFIACIFMQVWVFFHIFLLFSQDFLPSFSEGK
jgi:hypothetical protein